MKKHSTAKRRLKIFQQRIVICIPTYNERKNITKLIPKIFDVLMRHELNDAHVLVIDDNSPDGTASAVKALQPQYPKLHLLLRTNKEGLGRAYIAGFRRALSMNPDIIFEMDADFSHDPEMIPHFVKALNKSDVCVGSRRVKGGQVVNWGFHRQLISAGANFLTHLILRLKTRDVTSGYRAIRARLLRKIMLESLQTNGYAFQIELLYLLERKLDARIVEIPITFVDRQQGKSKLGAKSIVEFFITVIRLFLVGSPVPIKKGDDVE